MLFDIVASIRKNGRVCAISAVLLWFVQPAAAFDLQLRPLDDEQLTQAIETASLSFTLKNEDNNNPQDILAAARADYRQILTTLYQNAYYGGEISIRVDGQEAAEISPFFAPNTIKTVVMKVTPGPKFEFGDVSIAPQAPNTVLPEDFAVGKPALSAKVGEATQVAVNAWRDAGHAKAKPTGQDIVADHRNHTLDASIRLDPGPEIRFGKMIITTNGDVRDARIRQIVGFPTGKTFSPEEVDVMTERLRDTDAFRSVVFKEGEQVTPDGTMDMSLELVAEKPRRLGFGAEIYSSAGLSVSAYWTHRNIFGGAENLSFKADISGIYGAVDGIDSSFNARLSRPGTLSPLNTFFVGLEISNLNEPTYSSSLFFLETGVVRKFSDNLQVTASLGLRYSDVFDDFGHRQFRHAILSFTGLQDRRDNDLNPHSGTYLEAEASPYFGLAGSASGAILTADARAYYSPGENNKVTFAARTQLGSILGSDLQTTPPEFMFYSGGADTVRGQPYQSLNISQGGITTGGLSFLGVSLETRISITDTIGVVVFGDAGYVGTTSVPGQNGSSHSGAGLGLRYDTGVGPIRFDVAAPVTGTTGNGVQFYIGIGQAF